MEHFPKSLGEEHANDEEKGSTARVKRRKEESTQKDAQHKYTLFGHGWYNPHKNAQAPADMVFYGPPGSTLTRAVSKWVREKAIPLTSKDLRLITNRAFETIQKEYQAGPTFDKKVWEKAKENAIYPKHINKNDQVPYLLLEPQKEEDVPEAEDVIQVKRLTSLDDIARKLGGNVVLHWGSCLQELDTKIRDSDIMVILDPELSAQIYEITEAEMKAERKAQILHAKEEALKKQLSSQLPSRDSNQEKIKLEDELGTELVKILSSGEFDTPAEITDEQATRMGELAKEYGKIRGKLMRYVNSYIKNRKG